MQSVQQEDFDEVISILGNPTRRLILERLSHEPSYSLQIAQDLGISQQLVTSHLRVMEDAGLVASVLKKSKRGPKRRVFALCKSLLLTLELAPSLFNSRIVSFAAEPKKKQLTKDSSQILDQLQEAKDAELDHVKIDSFADILKEIDARLDGLEKERAILLYLRNLAIMRASDVVSKVDELEVRRILYYVLDTHDVDVRTVSSQLNMREETVRIVLKALKENQIFSE